MLLPYFIAFLPLLAVSKHHNHKTDFCDPDLCPNQGKHIACENDGSFGPDCEGKYWLEDITSHKQLILHLHNKARNKLAMGRVDGFDSAARMPTLRWDNQLAFLAELNAKTCYFEHDECRSTVDFPYCGQNIYFATTTFTNYTTVDFIKEAVEMWFQEHLDANMDIMKSFRITEPQTGHFTVLMCDRNDRVGCGLVYSIVERRHRKPLKKVIFACNYPSTNIDDLPLYKPGPPASLCKKRNNIYRGLCEWHEKIDPNDFLWYFK